MSGQRAVCQGITLHCLLLSDSNPPCMELGWVLPVRRLEHWTALCCRGGCGALQCCIPATERSPLWLNKAPWPAVPAWPLPRA